MNNYFRILYFESSSGCSGSAGALASLINNLDRKRFTPVVLVTNYGTKIETIRDAEISKIKGYKEPEKPNIFSMLALLKNTLVTTIKILVRIWRKKITLVHINTNITLGIPAILAAKICGVPCVSHIRETRKLIKRELLFAKLINKTIVLNKEAYSNYNLNIDKNRLSLIYDGLNLEEYRNFKSTCFREEYNLNSAMLIGSIGRIVEGKGQKEFVLVAKEILEKKQNIKFVITGDAKTGPDAYFKNVKELAASNNLDESLIFTGWREDVKNVLSALDIFVFTSTTYAEGLPNIIIEAMALAKPVVSTRIAGPADIVVDGKTGFLVPAGDIRTMANKIIYLLEHPDIARRMGEEGRKRAEELFDIKKQVKKIEALYQEVLVAK
jgi:glycosyltransferase involved in cell wall biosynthesis